MKYENQIIHGDCLEVMKDFPLSSIDAVVTDPPYGLEFMGKDWDDFKPREYQKFSRRWGKLAKLVLKPGGYLLAFSGTRTYHRMVCGLEDAGFVIKDQIDWLYGNGFPKSHNISKAIDKRAGKKRPRSETQRPIGGRGGVYEGQGRNWGETKNIPQTKEARKWQDWGTALKPAHEPIVLAQKPYEDTYAENVLKYGVGGLNINATRVQLREGDMKRGGFGNAKSGYWDEELGKSSEDYKAKWGKERKGRWPTNIILDPKAAKMLDEQSGIRKSGSGRFKADDYKERKTATQFTRGDFNGYGDKGGASRFFYCAKAHKSERNAGLEDSDIKEKERGEFTLNSKYRIEKGKITNERTNKQIKVKNDIATLKPINLMRYLVRLVTPPKGIVLDPFAGSGTTGIACVIEGFNYILIEKRERFAKVIAPKRIEYWSKEKHLEELKNHRELPNARELKNKDISDFL